MFFPDPVVTAAQTIQANNTLSSNGVHCGLFKTGPESHLSAMDHLVTRPKALLHHRADLLHLELQLLTNQVHLKRELQQTTTTMSACEI